MIIVLHTNEFCSWLMPFSVVLLSFSEIHVVYFQCMKCLVIFNPGNLFIYAQINISYQILLIISADIRSDVIETEFLTPAISMVEFLVSTF